tara:strand:+ start:193 stop:546 length:354 start_codon:yes stop_codon:yes gene_type:complete
MKFRHSFLFIYGIPGIFLAGIIAFYTGIITEPILWLFGCGDFCRITSQILHISKIALAEAGFLLIGHYHGKKVETLDNTKMKIHLITSIVISAIITIIMLFITFKLGLGYEMFLMYF